MNALVDNKPEIRTSVPAAHISSITFKNGEKYCVGKDDIVIFVGPNNSGKSRALKDIRSLSSDSTFKNSIVIDSVEIKKQGEHLQEILSQMTSDYDNVYFMGTQYYYHQFHNYFNSDSMEGIGGILMCMLNTESRLQICSPPQSIDVNQPKTHPFHYIDAEPEYRKLVSEYFYKAFGYSIQTNSFGSNVHLCLGDECGECVYDTMRELLNSYPKINEQGDGMRSFMGILLYLIMKTYCVYLIDEPEAFLHPPQAKIMGKMIGDILNKNQQAFISTHSDEIVKGLLEACPSRVKVIRITRQGNSNHTMLLDNLKMQEVWRDPILRFSNILSGLFHSKVVLCESFSDCLFYSTVLTYLTEKQNKYSDAHFTFSSGKTRMDKIISALRAVDVDVITIVDIDVLMYEKDIKKIASSYGIEWEQISSYYATLSSALISDSSNLERQDVKDKIISIIDKSQESNLTSDEVGEIKKTLKLSSPWGKIKADRFSATLTKELNDAFDNIIRILKSHHIFVVENGELESFFPGNNKHGPDWAITVLEQYHDLDSEQYDKTKEFIESWEIM